MGAHSDVALIFPPLWHYPHIPPELVTLVGYLRSRDLSVLPMDLNADAADHFTSPTYLRRTVKRLHGEWSALNNQIEQTPADRLRIAELARALPAAPSLVGAAEDAKRTLRDPDAFYNPKQHQQAVAALKGAWRLISLLHAPTEIDPHNFHTPYDERTVDGCLQAARDSARNPYVAYVQERVLPSLLEASPSVVALIFTYPDQIIPLMTLVAALRDAGSDAHVTLLGSLEDVVNLGRCFRSAQHSEYEGLFRLIDSVILHEAEPALAGLARAIATGNPLDQIPNLALWEGERLKFPERVEVTDLDSLPEPDYGGLPLEQYLFPEPVFAILSSRGCYWNRCSFCAISKNQLSYRTRRVELVVEDLSRLQARYGVRWFQFRDMLMSPAYLRRFSRLLLDRGLEVRWTCRARFEPAFTRELLALMARAGCVQVWFGLESASPRVLGLMDKGTDLAVVDRILDDCDATGIGAILLTIHGFPTETPGEAEETVAFLESRAEKIDYANYSDFKLYEGTPVWETSTSFGVTLPEGETPLFQYPIGFRSPEEGERNHREFAALRQRVDGAIPMPLLHIPYVSMYRERRGPGAWKVL